MSDLQLFLHTSGERVLAPLDHPEGQRMTDSEDWEALPPEAPTVEEAADQARSRRARKTGAPEVPQDAPPA